MNLILLDPSELDSAGTVALDDARATHLIRVLQATAGRTVRVGLIDGPTGTAVVSGVDGRNVTLQCSFHGEAPPRPRVDLLLALPRPKVMRRLWAQLAALGVGRIMLTNAERVERHYFDTHILDEACYRPLLIEGLQQAVDTRVPSVSIHRQLKVLVEDHLDALAGDSFRLAADPRGAMPVSTAVRRHDGRRVLLAVGPEGGWNDFELAMLDAHGFHVATLGRRMLRVDTACTALLAIVHDVLRDGESTGESG